MDREVMIQYSGPYLIQTTEAIMMGQTVESLNIVVDRGALLEEENRVNVYQQEERQCLVMPGIRKMNGKLEVKEERMKQEPVPVFLGETYYHRTCG